MGKILFVYLGLSIGGDPRRLAFWEPVLKNIKSRLSGWQSRFLSYGGRLVLLKSVLTALLVYALSFFKAPSGIISAIESIFNKKFWGGSEDNKKISWIAWSSVCLRKEYGGLGVRKLHEFNSALLGKCCWRMLVDRGGLWYRVLVARYGEKAGRLEVGGRSASSWWREVVKIRDGVGDAEGGWFAERVSKKVGDGTSTYFWYDKWLGDVPLCTRFRRLFDLASNKLSTVAEMVVPSGEAVGESWGWRRGLRVWEEEMLEECRQLLNGVVLQFDLSDRWLWDSDSDAGYTVRSAYQQLTTHAEAEPPEVTTGDLIWHKKVPLKVSIFAWRLLRDRLPTKNNLLRRGVVDAEAVMCVTGCGLEESVPHLFIHCPTFGTL